MTQRHKWADVIIAWADGKTIQFKTAGGDWADWLSSKTPTFDSSGFEWRIKPAEPVVRWQWIYGDGESCWFKTSRFLTEEEAANHFNAAQKRFKDESSQMEFPAE